MKTRRRSVYDKRKLHKIPSRGVMILTVTHIKISVVIWPDKIGGSSNLTSDILVTFRPASVSLPEYNGSARCSLDLT